MREDGSIEPFQTSCPGCGRKLVVTSDWKICVRWRRVLGEIVGRCLMPIFFLDAVIWIGINHVSVFAQKAFGVSKYLLALCSYVLGLAAMYTFEASDNWLLSPVLTATWTLISYEFLLWCWRKVKEGDKEDGDILIQQDVLMTRRSRSSRFLLLIVILAFIPLEILSPDGFALSLSILNLGHYLVDSTFVPPSRRHVIEMGHRWLGNEI